MQLAKPNENSTNSAYYERKQKGIVYSMTYGVMNHRKEDQRISQISVDQNSYALYWKTTLEVLLL